MQLGTKNSNSKILNTKMFEKLKRNAFKKLRKIMGIGEVHLDFTSLSYIIEYYLSYQTFIIALKNHSSF